MRPPGMVVDRHFVHDAMLQPRDLLRSAYRSRGRVGTRLARGTDPHFRRHPGEAFGCHGGYIATDAGVVDDIRSCAPGFTFTPALPPMIAAAALASIWHVRADAARRSALF